MKKIVFFIITLNAFGLAAFAQQDIIRLNNVVGKTPLRTQQYSEHVGSPFFIDDWSKGIIKDVNGSTVKDIELKYDELNDELLFKSKDGQELGFAVPVNEFVLNVKGSTTGEKHTFKNGFPPFSGSKASSYYQVLYNTDVVLLKKNFKRVEESRMFNTATITKTIVSRSKYFVFKEGRMIDFKRDNKSVQLVFADKLPAVQKYISEHKLDLKSDNALIDLFKYYSTIN